MKVFVSWSGDFSKKIALAVKDWIEQCIQSVEAFVSNEDIEKGENWSARLTNELSNTNYGIVCLTSDNIVAPWIHFEAGALSNMVDSRVTTIAVDVPYSEIKGPLSKFQNTRLEKDEMFKLLKSINSCMETRGEKTLSEEKLKNSFEAFWEQFNAKIKVLFEEHKKEPIKKTSNKVQIQQSEIDELLQLVRSHNSIITDPSRLLPFEYLEAIFLKITNNSSSERIYGIVHNYLRRTISLIRRQNLEKDKFIYRSIMQELEMFVHALSRVDKEWRVYMRDIEIMMIEFNMLNKDKDAIV